MSEAENENRRRIDKLQSDFEKSEVERKANKDIQEARMKEQESSLKQVIADNRAAFEKSLAETRTATAEAKAAFEKALAENRAAVARNEVETAKLRTTIEKQGKWQIGFILSVATLGVCALGLYWQYLQSGVG